MGTEAAGESQKSEDWSIFEFYDFFVLCDINYVN